MRAFDVPRGDVTLRVTTWGEASERRPSIVLVHGFPDSSTVWTAIAERLAARYHVVAYDVRGAGASSDARDYSLAALAADLAAVIDATCAAPVHLVGHDWGSIQAWEAVTDPAFRSRLASFTSACGPCLDHVGMRMRREPRRALHQLARSWYILVFQVPGAKLLWRHYAGARWPALLRRLERVEASPGDRRRDGANGVSLYRRNMLPRVLRPRERRSDLPIQLIVPTGDPFVEPAMLDDVERWCPNIWRRPVDTGHWGTLDDAARFVSWMDEWLARFEQRRAI